MAEGQQLTWVPLKMAPAITSPATVTSPNSILNATTPAVVVETDFANTPTSRTTSSAGTDTAKTEESAMRSMSISHHLASTVLPSRTWLTIRAKWWRSMMALGMVFHFWHPTRAPRHRYVHRMNNKDHPIKLYVYVPDNYDNILRADPNYRFPAVVNFHGGGFCIGHATDDAYWARIVLKHTQSIFISVAYRMAPEHPFPKPVDDCVEALLYLSAHAREFHIDPSNMALSGFSAGANLAFTSLLKLRYHHRLDAADNTARRSSLPPTTTSAEGRTPKQRPWDLYHASSTLNHPTRNNPITTPPPAINPRSPAPLTKSISTTIVTPIPSKDDPPSSTSGLSTNLGASTSTLSFVNDPTTNLPLTIRTIIAWYPLCDWTASRNRKRRLAINPSKTLNPMFTDLFDPSYLPPPDLRGDHISPYASPGLAPEHMIVNGLPQHIQMWLCEWDMLLQEGINFADRLTRSKKDVSTEILRGKRHGFDKSPNPFRNQAAIDALYIRAAERLNRILDPDSAPDPDDHDDSFHV